MSQAQAPLSAVSILEAMLAQLLFGPYFRGGTWDAWKAFLAAMFALPMDDAAQAIYRAQTGRTTLPNRAFRRAALAIGRRGGKSRVLALIAVYLACFSDCSPYLAPGEKATVAIIAADRKQARTILRYITGMFEAVPMLGAMVEDQTADTITLNNNVVIEIATASFRVTRGYTFLAVLCDEVAFWRSEDSANPDVEIISALRPGLSTIPFSVLLLASSPYRKRGILYNEFKRHFGQDDAPLLFWQAPTLIMNPGLDPSIVEEALEEDPEGAAAEYLAEFRNDLSDFVQRDVVDRCVIPGRVELPRLTTGWPPHVAFVDLAGGGADSMVLAIAHKSGDTPVLDMLREIKGPCSPEAAVVEFAAMIKLYGLTQVTGDRYAAEWPVERFKAHGITYKTSERTKAEIYLNVLPLLNSGKLELLDNRTLISQLCALERRTARGGRDSIDHPPGGHDDVANAALGALLLAGGDGVWDGNYDWI